MKYQLYGIDSQILSFHIYVFVWFTSSNNIYMHVGLYILTTYIYLYTRMDCCKLFHGITKTNPTAQNKYPNHNINFIRESKIRYNSIQSYIYLLTFLLFVRMLFFSVYVCSMFVWCLLFCCYTMPSIWFLRISNIDLKWKSYYCKFSKFVKIQILFDIYSVRYEWIDSSLILRRHQSVKP